MEKLLQFLEKRPRELVLCGLLFTACVTAVSGICFYTLNEIVESERNYMRVQIALAKSDYDSKLEILRERAKVKSEDVDRLVSAFIPVLKREIQQLEEVRDSIRKQPDSTLTQEISLKIDVMLARNQDLIFRLEDARMVGAMPTPSTMMPAGEWVFAYLMKRAMWTCLVIATVVVLLTGLVLKRQKKPQNQ